MDSDYFFNKATKQRKPSVLREIANKIFKMSKGSINLAGGFPDVQTFPFQEFSFKLRTGEHVRLADKELAVALQYLPTLGYGNLLTKLKEIQNRFHGPQDWNAKTILITCGAQQGLAYAFEMILERGDPVIIAEPAFELVLNSLKPFEPEYISIAQDSMGVIIEDIENILSTRRKHGWSMPKVIYINPTGSNPTGIVMPNDRRRELYRLACEYNIIILEDDPYFFLNFQKENPISFLSMDTESRVIRVDSFSKIMSPGMRLGYVTGSTEFVLKMEMFVQNSILHVSSLSQMVAYKLLTTWNDQGFDAHVARIKEFYRQKRDCMMRAVAKHLGELAECCEPAGGMFLWLKIDGLQDTKRLVTENCLEKHVIFAPGFSFGSDHQKPSQYVRVSYSVASPEDIDRGISLLAVAIREELLMR
ncbi:kynurenine/alpha-aminoadipate aminotransferase, mitochondrial-like [Adelges cooleyi]|uniref:kynurenine/alpha-aminoadipate aminotransferase, mitochondrial-like n=1 Tax=Adelges cooleyi TaxID=133065 RepID=UPI0021807E29|nr:kynurenine/alpha-aminoadipate aminotransferase, mitochondrial-like [Adelges cooleyi]